ncbi:hypothetical protein R3I94_008605 [Phoxinus phoxinus]
MKYLHKLVFRPTADINHWIGLIEETYGNLRVERIPVETQPPRFEISINGTWLNLRKFMRDFQDNLGDINMADEDDDDDDEEALPNVQNLHLGNP